MPQSPGLKGHAATSWAAMCERVAELVQDDPVGPLEFDLVVTPGPAHRRALSQYLASRAGGPLLSAGLEFVTWHGLLARLTEAESGSDDPWRGNRAALAVWDAINANHEMAELEPLVRHIGAPGERPGRPQATSARIARLFGRYAEAAPLMVAGWLAGHDVDTAGAPLGERDRWQPVLWRAMADQLGADPAQRRAELLARLGDGPVAGLPARVRVLGLADLTAADLDLLTALATHHEVHHLQLSGTARNDGPGSAFARRYGRRPALCPPGPSAAQGSLLARVQHEIANDLEPAAGQPDDSIQVHVCHGPDRQVAVLRDVLTGLFTDDPELQPRDVVVLCTDLAAYAPLIAANFGLVDDADADFHPGHRLRVQLSNAVLGNTNPVLQVLERLFELHSGRATSVDLLDLCALGPIAERFGFGADDLETLTRLVAGAQIRWGVDLAQRQRNGVPVTQSTWFVGVERMLVSLALETDPPVALGAITPVPEVDGEAVLIGALAELVSRVRMILGDFGAATPAHWARRLRAALDLLVAVPFEDTWQLTQVYAMLNTLAEQAVETAATWQPADAAGWLAQQAARLTGRPNHGNGSLLFTTLGDLQAVEHKVVCVLGLDDQHFPGGTHVDGDDLLTRSGAQELPHWSTDRRTRRRQQLLDALLAARQHFVVVSQGADESTGLVLPQPIAVADLLAAANLGAAGRWRTTARASIVRWHPLQPHGETAFGMSEDRQPFSFDAQALDGAIALAAEPDPAPAHHRLEHQIPATAGALELEDLISFLTNPAKGLLNSVGTGMQRYDTELADTLPIDPSSLDGWNVGASLLDSLLAGHDPEQSKLIELLNGRVLPGPDGERLIDDQLSEAEEIAGWVRVARRGPEELLDCSIDFGEVRLQGRVRLHGSSVVVHRFGKVKPQNALACWVRLLAVAASDHDVPELNGVVIGRTRHSLTPPSQAEARSRLAELIRLREIGLRQVLPLPLESAAAKLDYLGGYGSDPLLRAEKAFTPNPCYGRQDPDWTYFFADFDELLSVRRPGAPEGSPPWFVALADWLIEPLQEATGIWRPQLAEEVS